MTKHEISTPEKAFQLLKCFFLFRADSLAGAIVEILLRMTWELPQQCLGVVYGLALIAAGRVDQIGVMDGSMLLRTNFGGGMTLGNVITSSSPGLDRHEWGHTMQSRIFGPLYLPVFGIPSFLRASVIQGLQAVGYLKDFTNADYYTFYAESFADYLSNKFLRSKLTR